jgi:fumarate hydratase class II
MYRRALLAAAVAFVPMLAKADESISGQWQAHLPDNVIIAMDVLADGYWTSETVHNNEVVAQMAGSYKQEKTNSKSGTRVHPGEIESLERAWCRPT